MLLEISILRFNIICPSDKSGIFFFFQIRLFSNIWKKCFFSSITDWVNLLQFIKTVHLGICNSGFNLYSWLRTDGNNLFSYPRKAAWDKGLLVDSHQEIAHVLDPPYKLLPCCDSQFLGGPASWPFKFVFFETLMKSAHIFSRDFTVRLERVIGIQWTPISVLQSFSGVLYSHSWSDVSWLTCSQLTKWGKSGWDRLERISKTPATAS